MFLVPCCRASASSRSILVSKYSCFLLSISSVSRSRARASCGEGPPRPLEAAEPPPLKNLEILLIVASEGSARAGPPQRRDGTSRAAVRHLAAGRAGPASPPAPGSRVPPERREGGELRGQHRRSRAAGGQRRAGQRAAGRRAAALRTWGGGGSGDGEAPTEGTLLARFSALPHLRLSAHGVLWL